MKSLFPKTTCLGSEALDIIGRHLFPKQWTGNEIDARRLSEPQKAESARRKVSQCSEAFELHSILGFFVSLNEFLTWPDPNSDEYAIEREGHRRWRTAASNLNAALRYGHVPFWVVTNTGERIDIPAHWLERPLRISIGALLHARARQATNSNLNSARELKRPGLDNRHDKQIAGTLYVDRCKLLSALGISTLNKDAAKKGGSRSKYNKGLQSFMNQLSAKFAETGKTFTLPTFNDWLLEVANKGSYETGIPDFEDLDLVEDTLYWVNRRGDTRSLKVRSLQPYIKRAKQP